ncbi:AbgT family transporter [Rhizosaccharibacter radicis]|uniref:AbgT family transporter n=1 Tax=Rhizosaccharibacter radicis TaxID=2782605 RepID=A0ABT1W286_9PROT|nr:AbgT family transporter [Acetobacteraceae bacterium KSS12]
MREQPELEPIAPSPGRQTRFFDAVERLGNRLPNLTGLFAAALLLCLVLSALLSPLSFPYRHPLTGEPLVVHDMLRPRALLDLLAAMPVNFVGFPPLGVTVVVTVAIGVADRSGFVEALLRRMLSVVPARGVTVAVATVGVAAHLASDAAYVVLMPTAAAIFHRAGRHPVAGIACAFAGLAGGFSASFTPSIIDPVLQSFTQNAARIMDRHYEVNVLCNYGLSAAGTLAVIAVCTLVTERVVEPRLRRMLPVTEAPAPPSLAAPAAERRGFRLACASVLALLVLLAVLSLPAHGLLRAPDGSLSSARAPLMRAIVAILALFFFVPGLVHGLATGRFRTAGDVVSAAESAVAVLVPFLVFAFVAGQFLWVFAQSQLGTLLALSGADALRRMGMPAGISVLGLIGFSCALDALITSASSKWSLLAPVFVPMLMAVHISPELTQAAFRVSSTVNVATPLFAFYPLIMLYCRQYSPQTGTGTLCASMLPYTIGLTLALAGMLYGFWWLGIPMGPGASYRYGAGAG